MQKCLRLAGRCGCAIHRQNADYFSVSLVGHATFMERLLVAWRGFKCTTCGVAYGRTTDLALCAQCGGILFADYALEDLRADRTADAMRARSPQLLLRWRELMPVTSAASLDRASLGETESPYVEAPSIARDLNVHSLGLKLDCYLPSGSLKDRPQSAAIAGAIERGVSIVSISSSGNAGASLAAHGAKAGIGVVVGLFDGVPSQKLSKILAFGPTVVQVFGGMDTAEHVIRSLSARWGWLNCEAFVNPYALEGEKTIAFEIAAQCNWEPPDVLFLPLGNAACVVAPHKGFRELHALGLVRKVPRLVGVQFEACAPIARAFEERAEDIRPFARKPSFSSTLMHECPISGRLALNAIRESGGAAIAVTDDQVRAAMCALARQAGIFAEPAGAIALAGAKLWADQGKLRPSERIACLVSGSGMNQLDAMPLSGRIIGPLPPEELINLAADPGRTLEVRPA